MKSIRILLALLLLAIAPAHAGDVAQPVLRVTTLDGKPFNLAGERGKWVIVNFWATWCTPCLGEMPALSAYVSAHSNDVAAIGLAYDDVTPADLRAFLRKHPVSYPVSIVDVDHPPKDFATPQGLPTTYLIAPDGRVAKKFIGPVTPAQLQAIIGAGKARGA